MYEEPYRWVEAVGNRRQYLDEQFKQGSPLVAFSYGDGILMLTFSRGTPKLYEIYDRIGLGGMGHPADLERLRSSLLEMAHLEGFNRSPSDVTASRLMKYGLAPVIKQAFEDIFKAPFIAKFLLAQLGTKPGTDSFLTINYDGAFEETERWAVVAATPDIQACMAAFLAKAPALSAASLGTAVAAAVRAWALGSLAQSRLSEDAESDKDKAKEQQEPEAVPDEARLNAHLKEVMDGKTIECVVLDRHLAGASKYRALKPQEAMRLLPSSLQPC
jgi:proteasome alpha subunit